MTLFLTWLFNQKPLKQRLIAIGTLAGAVFISTAIVFSAFHHFNGKVREIQEKREFLARLERTLSLQPTDKSLFENDVFNSNIFLEGENAASASATLHTMLESMAASHSATLSSVAPLALRKSGDVDLVGIEVTISGTLENVHKVIFSLESATPPLLINDLRVQSAPQQNRKSDPKLALKLNLFGALATENQQFSDGGT